MNRIKSISYLKSFYSFTAWRHFSFQWCIRQTVDKAMMQWSIYDSAIGNIWWHDRALRHHYCTIVSSHYLFTVPSNLSSLHRRFIDPGISCYRTIDPKHDGRWCDSELHGPTWISYYTELCIIFLFSLIKKNILVNMTHYNLKTTT